MPRGGGRDTYELKQTDRGAGGRGRRDARIDGRYREGKNGTELNGLSNLERIAPKKRR